MTGVDLNVNGRAHHLDVELETPLLYILRNDLELNGPKFGCGLGQCSACTVIMDGEAVQSCQTPVSRAAGHEITTLEGLGTAEKPHKIQQAFIAEQAAQCGYCLNGIVMTAKAFIDKKPDATEPEIRQALAGNLCRCGTHLRFLRAVARYAREVRS